MRAALGLCCGLVLVCTAPVAGDVNSGPTVGEKAPALKVFAVVGKQENKEVDYVAEQKDAPTIYLLVPCKEGRLPVGGRPVGGFIKELDKTIKEVNKDAYVVAVWLTENPDETKTYLPIIQQALQMENTAPTYSSEKGGPNNWGANADAHLTAAVVVNGKVAATFGFVSTNREDVPKVRDALKKALEKK